MSRTQQHTANHPVTAVITAHGKRENENISGTNRGPFFPRSPALTNQLSENALLDRKSRRTQNTPDAKCATPCSWNPFRNPQQTIAKQDLYKRLEKTENNRIDPSIRHQTGVVGTRSTDTKIRECGSDGSISRALEPVVRPLPNRRRPMKRSVTPFRGCNGSETQNLRHACPTFCHANSLKTAQVMTRNQNKYLLLHVIYIIPAKSTKISSQYVHIEPVRR